MMSDNFQEKPTSDAKPNEATQPLKTKNTESKPAQPESLTEKTQPLPKATNLNVPDWLIEFAGQKEPSTPSPKPPEETREIRVQPQEEPALAKEETQPIHVAAATPSVWQVEAPASEAANEVQANKVEAEAQVSFPEAFAAALDGHNNQRAQELLEQHSGDPIARSAALRSLRSRLNMQPANQPLWEMYADLNAKEMKRG